MIHTDNRNPSEKFLLSSATAIGSAGQGSVTGGLASANAGFDGMMRNLALGKDAHGRDVARESRNHDGAAVNSVQDSLAKPAGRKTSLSEPHASGVLDVEIKRELVGDADRSRTLEPRANAERQGKVHSRQRLSEQRRGEKHDAAADAAGDEQNGGSGGSDCAALGTRQGASGEGSGFVRTAANPGGERVDDGAERRTSGGSAQDSVEDVGPRQGADESSNDGTRPCSGNGSGAAAMENAGAIAKGKGDSDGRKVIGAAGGAGSGGSASTRGGEAGSSAATEAARADGAAAALDGGEAAAGAGTAAKGVGEGVAVRGGGKAALATTIRSVNQQLLTIDPRRMLLGLDTLGGRMMMAAAQLTAGAESAGRQLAMGPAEHGKGSESAKDSAGAGAGSDEGGGAVGGGVRESMGADGADASGIAPAAQSASDAQAGGIDRGDATTRTQRGFAAAADESVRVAAAEVGGGGASGSVGGVGAADGYDGQGAGGAMRGEDGRNGEKNAAGRSESDLKGGSNGSNGSADRGRGEAEGREADQLGRTGGGLSGSAGGVGGVGGGGGGDGRTNQAAKQERTEHQPASRALAQQVERAVASAGRQAERMGGAAGPITLRLKPESLGQVRIKLSAGESGGGLGVRIEVGTTDAQRLLSESMGSLREALKAKGLVLEHGGVGVDPSLAGGRDAQGETVRGLARQADAARVMERQTNETGGGPGAWTGQRQGEDGESARRGRDDEPRRRGGFFDGAVLVPGGTGRG